MVELYRRRVWTDARTVNVIASACLSKARVPLSFFLDWNISVCEACVFAHTYKYVSLLCVRPLGCIGIQNPTYILLPYTYNTIQSTRLCLIAVHFFLGIEQRMADDDEEGGDAARKAHKMEASLFDVSYICMWLSECGMFVYREAHGGRGGGGGWRQVCAMYCILVAE